MYVFVKLLLYTKANDFFSSWAYFFSTVDRVLDVWVSLCHPALCVSDRHLLRKVMHCNSYSLVFSGHSVSGNLIPVLLFGFLECFSFLGSPLQFEDGFLLNNTYRGCKVVDKLGKTAHNS